MSSLFSGLKLTIKTQENQYDLYLLVFRPTGRFILDICPYTSGSPLFQLIGDVHETQISFGFAHEQDAYNVVCSFLSNVSLPIPMSSGLPFTQVPINILAKEPYTLDKPLFFRTPDSTHKAVIKHTGLNYFVKIEGTRGDSCIEIFVENPTESPSVLAQIYSEEDCSYESFLTKGTAVTMIKASLQVCYILFGITQFELKDESNIECDTTPVPRKRIKPLSLAHMTIIKYGKTWYERNFNAYLKNPVDRNAYEKGLAALHMPIDLSFKDFYRQARFHTDHASVLEPLFITSSTWSEFFKKIPKEKHCELLAWAPSFLEKRMGFDVRKHPWIIDLEKMVNATVVVFTHNVPCFRGGGRRKTRSRLQRRKTRRQKPLSVFSNQFGGNILRI